MRAIDTTGVFQYGLGADAVYVRLSDPEAGPGSGNGASATVKVTVLAVQFGWMPNKTGPEARAGEELVVPRSELHTIVPMLPYYEVTDEAYRARAASYGVDASGVAAGGRLLALGVPTGTVMAVRHYIDFYFAAKKSGPGAVALAPMALMNPSDWEAQSAFSVAEIEARIMSGDGMPPLFRLV
jgi:hypothetical protein